MKISGPVSYHKLKINDNIFIHLFADAHIGNHKYNCKELYNDEDYTITNFLLNIYQNSRDISFYFEGHPESNKPADSLNDFLTDSNKEFRNINESLNNNQIFFTDRRQDNNLLRFDELTNKYQSLIAEFNFINDMMLDYDKTPIHMQIDLFNKYKIVINRLFEIITPLINVIKSYWKAILNDNKEFNQNINNFIKSPNPTLFEIIKKQFQNLHRDAVDYYTCDSIIGEIQNGRKNFILYFGFAHIDNIKNILKFFYKDLPFNLVETKHKLDNRCLDLNIDSFNDLLANTFNIENKNGGKKQKKKQKK